MTQAQVDRLWHTARVLVRAHVGLHVGRRHQAHRVAKCLKLTRPMVR